MQAGYFKTAWLDIKNSPGWVGTLVKLALVGLVPVFGFIVQYGYLYGWAREIAWGVHAPLPTRILANDDGRLYSRGFFALVIAVVCALVPSLVDGLLSLLIMGLGLVAAAGGAGLLPLVLLVALLNLVISLAMVVFELFMALVEWVGCMRMAIYGRLSAGFQVRKIWAMMRRDWRGLARILGMCLVMELIVAAALFVVALVVVAAVIVGSVAAAGFSAEGVEGLMDASTWPLALLVVVGVAACLLVCAAATFITTMCARAMGYWTRQFDVARWRGQDDPMPFELEGAFTTAPPGA